MQDKTIFHITMATTIISMIMFFIGLYFGWFGPFAERGSVFCESFHLGLIKQPINTWSSLAFIVVGLFIAWSLANRWYHHNRNMFTGSQFYGTLFCCFTVLVAPGSMALHAAGSDLGGALDRRSIYLNASFMVAYATLRLFRLQSIHFIVIFSFVVSTCLWVDVQSHIHFVFLSVGNVIFAFYVLVTLLFEIVNMVIRKPRYSTRWVLSSCGLILLSFFIWKMSLTGGPWCDPNSIIQGHAVWHTLDALALYCLFRFYVSEDYEQTLSTSFSDV